MRIRNRHRPSRDEFLLLFQQHISLAAVAKHLGIARTTLQTWLKDAGLSGHELSTHPSNSTHVNCPFEKDELHDLYWNKKLAPNSIAKIAADRFSIRLVHEVTVRGWLRKLGIPIKTLDQAQAHKREDAELMQKLRAVAAKNRVLVDHSHPNMRKGFTQEERVAGGKKCSEIRRLASLATRQCCNPECGKTVTRNRGQFRSPVDRTFCSPSCKSKTLADEAIVKRKATLISRALDDMASDINRMNQKMKDNQL